MFERLQNISKKTHSEVAIKVENLSKTFYINEDAKMTLRSLVASLFNQGKTKRFRALNNFNFTIKKGEFVGIIGKNGSGKSTLLKIISGIYSGDKGSKITVNGTLVPFLELGVGFNAELSGKENIYLNGTILGMSRKLLDSRFDQIVKFAELKEFIDTPVKNYSSGMMVRLAFSIAIQAESDIYILDEILAVGDAEFQSKSIKVVNRLVREGKTILFVSHDTGSIEKYCTRAILIDNHEIKFDGKTSEAINEYRKILYKDKGVEEVPLDNAAATTNVVSTNIRVGDKSLEILNIQVQNLNGSSQTIFKNLDDVINIQVKYKTNSKEVQKGIVGVAISRADGLLVTGTNTKLHRIDFIPQNEGVVRYQVEGKYFLDGEYLVTVGLFDYMTEEAFDYIANVKQFEIHSGSKDVGILSLPAKWIIDQI